MAARACIFQVIHAGRNEQDLPHLWPVHIMMTEDGDITITHRRPGPGKKKTPVVAKNMVGKSLNVKVQANGADRVGIKP